MVSGRLSAHRLQDAARIWVVERDEPDLLVVRSRRYPLRPGERAVAWLLAVALSAATVGAGVGLAWDAVRTSLRWGRPLETGELAAGLALVLAWLVGVWTVRGLIRTGTVEAFPGAVRVPGREWRREELAAVRAETQGARVEDGRLTRADLLTVSLVPRRGAPRLLWVFRDEGAVWGLEWAERLACAAGVELETEIHERG